MAKKFTDRYDSRKWRLMGILKVLALAAVVLFFLFRFVVGLTPVSGNSMCNTLQDGDYVLYTRMVSEVKRGDIVSLSLPSGEYYVKRVVAVAGDTVDIRDGKVFINGTEENASYVLGETIGENAAVVYPCTIEEGQVFVLGDNRPESVDSRYYGSFNVNQVTGVLKLRMGFFYLNGL